MVWSKIKIHCSTIIIALKAATNELSSTQSYSIDEFNM
jgi:hypothetical protein